MKISEEDVEVSQQGRTVFYVSHDLNSIQQLCGRSFLIEVGRMIEDGKTGAVVAKYFSTFSSGAIAT